MASDSRKRGTCGRENVGSEVGGEEVRNVVEVGGADGAHILVVTCAGASVNRFCQYAHAYSVVSPSFATLGASRTRNSPYGSSHSPRYTQPRSISKKGVADARSR